ncbi:MAG: tripartite tricarboxylate transporter TctB family protein, partial [Rhodobacteraceae bacterium]|nr:tripartite tricarboxylate transporter TctB family protein [Paracoccaceae bacterium]
WRLGYRTQRWIATGFVSSFAIVLVFRTILQIKTPVSIWLYDQLPSTTRAFMLTYF